MIIIVALILLYLYLIKPSGKHKSDFKPYEERYIAHRGLFNNKDITENSLAAFKKASNQGFGIELDVQLTTDNKLVVYHDASLKRISGIDKLVYDCSYEELQGYHLLNEDERIPLFEEVLEVIDPLTPLIIEIKPDGRYLETVKRTVDALKDYQGIYCLESFNPFVVKWLKDNHPEIIRGQLAYNHFMDESQQSILAKFALTNLLFNFMTRPDFIAYDHHHASSFTYHLLRKLFKTENVAWTIKSEKELKDAKHNGYDIMIFDSFMPKGSN